MNIQLQSCKTQKADLSLMDIFGTTLIHHPVVLAAGVNDTSVNVQSLTGGIYFMKASTWQAVETIKIMVVK